MKKFLLLVIILVTLSGLLFAQGGEEVKTAPLSLEYLDYMMNPFNYEIPPVAVPTEFTYEGDDLKLTLPSSYSMLDEGIQTPIMDQGSEGMCWAFSGAGAAELNGAVKYSSFRENLSPLNILNKNVYKGIHLSLNSGGNLDHVESYYFNNIGPVFEYADPYVSPYNSPSTQPRLAGYVDNAYRLSGEKDHQLTSNEIKAIKEYIYQHGGVSAAYYSNKSYYSSDDESYYYPYTHEINHIIILVGWDDNYSKYNFKYTPAGNGAFLVKNSWGTDRHTDGYFWISYYDYTMCQAVGYDFTYNHLSNYNKIYTYCKGVGTNYVYNDNNTLRYGKAIFKPTKKGKLVGVRTHIPVAGVTIKATVSGKNGTIGTKTFTPDFTGYMSVMLDTPYDYAANETLTLIIQYNTTGKANGSRVPMESDGYNYTPSWTAGTSYYSVDGINWYDMGNKFGKNMAAGLLTFEDIPVTSISLNYSSISLASEGKDSSIIVKGTIKPNDATYSLIHWEITDKTVVKYGIYGLGESAKITALKPGDTTITVYDYAHPDVKATLKVHVYKYTEVTGLNVNITKAIIKKGLKVKAQASVIPTDANVQTINWSSSDTRVATVSTTGYGQEAEITGKKAGTAIITASSKEKPGIKKTIAVTVTEDNVKVTGVSLDKTEMTMKKGANKVLTATVKPSNATNKEVTWSSSDKEVAYVNASGKVSAYKAGVATITVKTKDGGYKATCKVTVTQPVTGIKLSKTSLTMLVGDEVKINATVKPEDATNKDVTWTSSDITIAKVNNGKITGKGKGKATITATSNDGGYKATCEVTVN